jgi:hypothetical protein
VTVEISPVEWLLVIGILGSLVAPLRLLLLGFVTLVLATTAAAAQGTANDD